MRTPCPSAADGKRVLMENGAIGLQAEYAWLMYRYIRIKELVPDVAVKA